MKEKKVKVFKIKDKLEAQKIFSIYAKMVEQAKQSGNFDDIDYEYVKMEKKLSRYHVILYREEFNLNEFDKL
jgi:hypothetical protein